MATRSRKIRAGQELPTGRSDEGGEDEHRTALGSGAADPRQLAARRRLEQYLEARRLNEHLREVFGEDEP